MQLTIPSWISSSGTQKKRMKSCFGLTCVQDPIQMLPLKRCCKDEQRVNILAGETKVNNSLQQFIVSKQNERKMEASRKKVNELKNCPKVFRTN